MRHFKVTHRPGLGRHRAQHDVLHKVHGERDATEEDHGLRRQDLIGEASVARVTRKYDPHDRVAPDQGSPGGDLCHFRSIVDVGPLGDLGLGEETPKEATEGQDPQEDVGRLKKEKHYFHSWFSKNY